MKLKLDENLGVRGAELLRAVGHDVSTVPEQSLCSTPDADLIAHCRDEARALVTLDVDFGNPLVFRPSDYSRIAVLRLPRKASHQDLIDTVQTLIGGLARENLGGRLWIVERSHIRVYQQQEEP